MMILILFVTFAISAISTDCPNYSSYLSDSIEWEDISAKGLEYLDIATNGNSPIIWARLQQKHHSGEGWQIAEYRKTGWLADESQPAGAK